MTDGPRLILAPMEGLLDDVLRDVLTRAGGYDWAVSEFARVSDTLLPHRYYQRMCPELRTRGRTPAGTSVRLQLLGSDPGRMHDNAAHLAELAPPGIDLNFGCPAPLVNRHRGGAILLDEPEALYTIATAVRRAVPPEIPFTAKMRLGVRDTEKALDCARALEAGGVEQIVVHARTKVDGYRPPAHWGWIGRVAEAVALPVVANGDIWDEASYLRCVGESGVRDAMLGRGAVADPFLARRLREGLATHAASGYGADTDSDAERLRRAQEWEVLKPLLGLFWRKVQAKVAPRHAPGRLKQWLGFLRRTFPQAALLAADILPLRLPSDISPVLARHGIGCDADAAGAGA